MSGGQGRPDRKSTRLNSSHRCISYAVFCLKKKTNTIKQAAPAQVRDELRIAPMGARTTQVRYEGPAAVLRATCRQRSTIAWFFFFFNYAAPPEFFPLPPPAAFPI